jgi:hypothetical protein
MNEIGTMTQIQRDRLKTVMAICSHQSKVESGRVGAALEVRSTRGLSHRVRGNNRIPAEEPNEYTSDI